MTAHQAGDHSRCRPATCLTVRVNPTPVGPYRPPQPVTTNWRRDWSGLR